MVGGVCVVCLLAVARQRKWEIVVAAREGAWVLVAMSRRMVGVM